MSEQDRINQTRAENAHKRTRKKGQFSNFITNLSDSDKQRFITFLAYIVIVLVAVLSSYLQVQFGTDENFKLSVFITNLAFNLAIGILALLLSIKDGRLSNETRRKGDLYETKKEFKQKSVQIVDVDSFRQWNDKTYEDERLDYIMTELAQINIYDTEYLFVSDADLEKLTEEPCECVATHDNKEVIVQLDKIDEYQYESIKYYRSGKFKFKKLPYSFFKSGTGRNEYKFYADNEGRDQKIEVIAYVYRIIMIVVFSVIISLAIVNPTGANGKQVAYDTVSRVANAVISIFMGYSLAHDEKNRLIDGLLFKIDKIEQYLTDIESGTFIPLNKSDVIRIKIEEIRKKRLEQEQTQEIPIIAQEESQPSATESKTVADQQQVEEVTIEMTPEEYEEYTKNHNDASIRG